MRFLQLLLFLFTGLAALAVAVLFIAPFFVDWERFIPQISREMSERLGREVSIEGEVGFVFFPAPALSVGKMRIANHPDGQDATMLTLEGMELGLALAPLLSGDIRARLHLRRPVLTLEHFAQGGTNWQGLGAEEASRAGLLDNISLDHFTLEEGVFRQLDHRSGRARIIGGIEGEIEAHSIFGPFTAQGRLLYSGDVYSVKLNTGRFSADRATPLGVQISREGAEFQLDFSGSATPSPRNGVIERTINGTLTINTEDIAALLAADTQERKSPIVSLIYESGLTLGRGHAELHDIKAELAGSKLGGKAAITYAGTAPEIRLTLSGDALDVPSLLGEAGAMEVWREAEALVASSARRWGLDMPEDTPFFVDAEFATLDWGEHKARDVLLNLETGEGGAIRQARLLAVLPGTSRLALNMARDEGGSESPLLGEASFTMLSPDEFLRWLTDGQSAAWLSAIDPALLTKWEGETRFSFTGSELLFEESDLMLAGSGVKARGRYGIEKQDIGLDLALARLDMERHGRAFRALLLPLLTGERQPIDDYSLTASLAMPRITLDGNDFAAMQGQVQWQNKNLALEAWEIELQQGGGASFSGVLEFASSQPKGQIEGAASIDDFAALLASAGFSLPPRQSRALADVGSSFVITLPAEDSSAQIQAQGMAGKSQFNLTAELAPWHEPASGQLDLNLAVSATSAPALARQAGLPEEMAEGRGEGHIEIALAGGVAETMQLKADLKLGTAKYHYAGTIARDDRDGFSGMGEIEAQGQRWGTLATSLGFLPAAPAASPPFSLAGKLEKRQSLWEWRDMQLRLGDADITSSGLFDRRANRRTFLEGQVKATYLEAGWFFPAPKANWPSSPLPGTTMRGLEGTLRFSADKLAVGRFLFTDANAQMELADGGWQARRFSAELAGGRLSGTFALSDAPRHQFSAALNLSGLDAQSLAAMVWQKKPASGILSLSAQLNAKGRSLLALISSIEGEGQVEWKTPELYGMDIALLDEAVSRATNPAQLETIFTHVMGDGETKLSSFTGGFSIEHGLLRLAPSRFTGEGVAGNVGAFIDLPRARVDSEWNFTLPSNRDLPDFQLVISGALAEPNIRPDGFELREGFAARIIARGIEQVETGGELPPDLLELLGLEN